MRALKYIKAKTHQQWNHKHWKLKKFSNWLEHPWKLKIAQSGLLEKKVKLIKFFQIERYLGLASKIGDPAEIMRNLKTTILNPKHPGVADSSLELSSSTVQFISQNI